MKKEPDINKTEDRLPAKDDSLQSLVEKNNQWCQVIYEQNRKIKRRLTMMVVGNYLRLFIIVAPIVLAIIYLPPLIEKLLSTVGGAGAPAIFGGGLPLQDILSQIKPEQIQELLKLLPR